MRLAGWEFTPSLLPSAAALAMLVLLLFLGGWQLERAEQKASLAHEHAVRADSAALELDAAMAGVSGPDARRLLRYQPVLAEGRYDAARQYLLDNRTHRGVPGYHVLTPLRLRGDRAVVLVNRGWVPWGDDRATLPDVSVGESPVRVRGIAAIPPADPLLLGESGYGQGAWPRVVQLVDLAKIGEELGRPVLPAIIRLDPAAEQGYVREWRPYLGIPPARHRAYAFQWFALAAALLVIYLLVTVRRAPRQDPDR